jgi:hypothetical protein
MQTWHLRRREPATASLAERVVMMVILWGAIVGLAAILIAYLAGPHA